MEEARKVPCYMFPSSRRGLAPPVTSALSPSPVPRSKASNDPISFVDPISFAQAETVTQLALVENEPAFN
jgi:hypothetical protein